jgi:Cu2+-exporting ATPase
MTHHDIDERADRGHDHSAEGGHHGHGDGHGHGGHGDHAAMFRDRFWITLALTIPVVVLSQMFQELLGYTIHFTGSQYIPPVLGSIVFI